MGRDGVMPKLLAALYKDLRKRGGIEDVESFIDGTYVPAKKGGPAWVEVVLARPRRSWRSQTAMVFHSLLSFADGSRHGSVLSTLLT
jgi:hypothetical protein